ncbi:response regulator transcription factor [Paenibacillus sp. GCM10012307]|uniref:Response regulator transcription factor n=1 Tax=Paenibacillus roseus TaxID=2798579 RepID=A0A934JBW5_9BACL|nr:response regulator transcription factor [Paenibacillus roseus]MBJ6363980.1 response regulator transcription factor [Paenibacillus roseus]
MRRILYIEDDLDNGSWVKEDLESRGFEVKWLQSGEGATQYVSNADLVILDIMLPGLDGFTIGRRLKKEAPQTPILMLSARTSVDDKLLGLQFADDYLTKPFHPDELAARIEVLLRRYGLTRQITKNHLSIELPDYRITDTRTGEEIVLTGKQYQIMVYFLKNPNRILTKEQIYESVWGEPFFDGDKTLMVHIRYLREKIEVDPSAPVIIETIRGIGYRVKQ